MENIFFSSEKYLSKQIQKVKGFLRGKDARDFLACFLKTLTALPETILKTFEGQLKKKSWVS
jgi:hypothetical protein